MPRCYMVKKGGLRHDGPPPCSPTEASVAPPCYTPDEHSAVTESRAAEYAELGSGPMSERSAADTEAAHELLSLAQSVPPLPPAAVVTVLTPEPHPVVPLYTYTIQPTNIYIIAEEPPDPIYHTVQTLAPLQQVEYTTVEPQVNYITYQDGTLQPTTVDYQPVYHESDPQHPIAVQVPVLEPVPVPVSVIEPTPMPVSVVEPVPVSVVESVPISVVEPVPTSLVEPMSVQVPVIEAVPHAHQPTPPLPPQSEQIAQEELQNENEVSVIKEKGGRYDCNECGKRYATSSNLSRHKQTHRSLDSCAAKRCGECGKAYVSMPALAMHVLTHRMGHVCGVCGKQFSRPWLLRGHLRSHTGEKPYSCAACGKAFADRSNLRAHLQTHSSEKRYECLRCNKSFALKSYLNKHQESACVRSDDE